MQPDRRKHRRVTLTRPCWLSLADGSTWGQCTLNNISAEGAKVVAPMASELKDRFEIHFTRDGSVAFGARVIWRNGNQVGVQFTDRPNRPK